MSLNKSLLKNILIKRIQGSCTPSEQEILDDWVSQHKKNQELLDHLMCSKNLEKDLIDFNLFDKGNAWVKLSNQIPQKEQNVFKIYNSKLLLAACIVLILISFSFLFIHYTKEEKVIDHTHYLTEGKVLRDSLGEILPATTGAILIKSDGNQVTLEGSFNIEQDGTIVLEGGNITPENEINEANSYYELIVPKAKVIHFTMFDGTKVWVNANSRLKFPRNIVNNERKISLLSGEAYFEVSKYENSKFLVDSENGTIEVLGTKFNVNTFNNNFKTTLVEGSIKLSNEKNEEVLKPNFSAILLGDDFKIIQANIHADLAWKNNIFYFNNYSIHRIAKQIEDWYGVKVYIGSNASKIKSTYSGELRRDVPLTEVRKMLEFISGLDVNIEGESLNIE